MASSSPKIPTEDGLLDYLDCQSIETAEDTSGDKYPLTLQPRITPRFCDIPPSPVAESQHEFNKTTEKTPEAPWSPETAISQRRTMTMDVPLEEVNLVRLFLRPDCSIKGISFTYEDGDMVLLGSCETDMRCWHAFVRPRYLLFTPAPDYTIGCGFFPVQSINFADVMDGSETESNAIEMQRSVLLHISPVGLEMAVGSQSLVKSAAVPDRTGALLEKVMEQPTTAPESPKFTQGLEDALDGLLGAISKTEVQEGKEKHTPPVSPSAMHALEAAVDGFFGLGSKSEQQDDEKPTPEAEQAAPEPGWRGKNDGTQIRCEKGVLGQVRALKGWFGLRSVLTWLRATRVRRIESKQNQ